MVPAVLMDTGLFFLAMTLPLQMFHSKEMFRLYSVPIIPRAGIRVSRNTSNLGLGLFTDGEIDTSPVNPPIKDSNFFPAAK